MKFWNYIIFSLAGLELVQLAPKMYLWMNFYSPARWTEIYKLIKNYSANYTHKFSHSPSEKTRLKSTVNVFFCWSWSNHGARKLRRISNVIFSNVIKTTKIVFLRLNFSTLLLFIYYILLTAFDYITNMMCGVRGRCWGWNVNCGMAKIRLWSWTITKRSHLQKSRSCSGSNGRAS